MTTLLDITATRTGQELPAHQAEVVASVKGLSVSEHLFIRGLYREKGLDHDADYVLVQNRRSGNWKAFKLFDLNREILKETANVP